jgi:hypothetical protein
MIANPYFPPSWAARPRTVRSLTNPLVVGGLVRSFLRAVCDSFEEGIGGDLSEREFVDGVCRRAEWLAEVFVGERALERGLRPLPGWNTSGGLDGWLTDQYGIEEATPVEVVKTRFLEAANQAVDVTIYARNTPGDGWKRRADWVVESLISDLLAGLDYPVFP